MVGEDHHGRVPGPHSFWSGLLLTAPGMMPSGVGHAGQRPGRGLGPAEKTWGKFSETVSKRREVDAARLGKCVKSKAAQKENTYILSVLTKRRTGLPKPPQLQADDSCSRATRKGQEKGPEPTRDHPPPTHVWVPGTEREPRHGPCPQGGYDECPPFSHMAQRLNDVLWATRLLGGGPGTRSLISLHLLR